MEIEDVIAEQKKDLQTKLDHTEKNCKVLEVKTKNYQDQGQAYSDDHKLDLKPCIKLGRRFDTGSNAWSLAS